MYVKHRVMAVCLSDVKKVLFGSREEQVTLVRGVQENCFIQRCIWPQMSEKVCKADGM